MSKLSITLINVGWGDSIFIESEDSNLVKHFALIDSNDKGKMCSSLTFLRRYFQLSHIDTDSSDRLFDFMLLSHEHSDHGQGLKSLMIEFGTRQFWYPKSVPETANSLAHLTKYASNSSKVEWHQAVDTDTELPNLGDATLEILWPQPDIIDSDPNNNSVVLQIKLGSVSYILTGDAEAKVWNKIASSIPADTRFFKVPHHGSVNGTFDGNNPAWLNDCPQNALMGISTHIIKYGLPDKKVIDLFEQNHRRYFRTDTQYHLTFETDGHRMIAKYAQVTDYN
jgi:competence protein ComEC